MSTDNLQRGVLFSIVPGRYRAILILVLLMNFITASTGQTYQGEFPANLQNTHIALIPASSLTVVKHAVYQPSHMTSSHAYHPVSTAAQDVFMPGDHIHFYAQNSSTTPVWRPGNWILLVLLLVVVLMIAGLRSMELSRIRLRDQIRQADFEAAKLKELNQLKSKFFTNISHEFRTPLTLIKGPVEQLMMNTGDPLVLKALEGVHTNAGRLLNLINQLLDLSRLESGQYNLKVAPGDISSFLKGQVSSFLSLTGQKGILLTYRENTSREIILARETIVFDREVIQNIINNLLSNAVKFTGENGRIEVLLTLKSNTERGILIEITVEDNGIGIAEEHLPYIFDRFYQVDSSPVQSGEGSGIGLAFVRELVVLHKGGITVDSKEGEGTRFSVTFPGSIGQYSAQEIAPPSEMHHTEEAAASATIIPSGNIFDPDDHTAVTSQKPLVLVVEDHYEVRQFIIRSLGDNYQVMEAPAARKGLELALQHIPDLIVSDIMMPGMDGLTFCSKIKNNEKTSHIPLIFLTARATDEDLMCGLENGADAYLTKPFSPRELEVRVKNLVETRRIMREKFDRQIVVSPGEIVVSSRDRQFMEKILRIVEEHISREDFMVEELAANAGMSQSQLQRKLKALINQSPNQLIRSVRLQRAKELISKNAGTISEISYMVGYGDPGYFTKSYKSYFGVLPSDEKNN